ncbi:MAG: glycosyltransferase [Sphingomonas sp.]|nr:glycosyltransferase [Sphingomonas sp.]
MQFFLPRPHILIAMHDFYPGGTEKIAMTLAGAWIDMGFRVSIAVGGTSGEPDTHIPAGATIVALDPPIKRSLLSRWRLGRRLADRVTPLRPDIIFLPGNYHFGLARAFRRQLPHAAIVAKISNPLITRNGVLLKAVQRFVLRRLVNGIDALAAMTPGLMNDAKALLPDMPVRSVPDPFLADMVIPLVPARPRPPKDMLRLVCIGRLEPQKHFGLAIEVVAAMQPNTKVHLTIVGEGRERPQLERAIARHGLQEHVTLTGYRPDVSTILRDADLLLICSRYEGGPAVAAEALIAGVPFVATDCSHYLRDLAQIGSFGTLAADSSVAALVTAIHHQQQKPRPNIADAAAALSANRLSHAAQGYAQLFESLQAGQRSAAVLLSGDIPQATAEQTSLAANPHKEDVAA